MEKKFPRQLRQLQQNYPSSILRVWAFDEHRVGLKPTQKRAWFPWWEVPLAPFKWKFEWSWVYGLVEPTTGATEWYIMPRVNHQSLSMVLKDFARTHHIDEEHPAVMVLDNARWHTTSKLETPPGLHLLFLPPYSPELQPAERLWAPLDEPIVNRYFDSIEELEEVLAERCIQLTRQPEYMKSLTHFHWWPDLQDTVSI